ncbi:YSIRK-type signal peptide-containing protein [Lactobacillus helveticus]|uniref:YSIRK-type signal peptide-containing protein n=1 Tax=Lactobacillus helveticus TaxID=1587 RepID=UPI00156225E3|nr:YSIRK-type signal peptide-containing protein [Lactobacillus helveticus]NRN90369.1 hypothetical protein [Lactobacillus helveticus]NRN94654.1 hypothetical protein [Lactobacillus helveticus]NRO31842.1 hypothetical protein [Lactobacillus helveticus]NRO45713.1 hypothetical protein [Lactobacillus helveticus]NRO55524.1 hypothetical protein [Lactobacillus helveticus]
MSKRKFLDVEKQKQRFSIRKLTIGAASVLLGTVFYLGNSTTTANAAISDGTKPPQVQIGAVNKKEPDTTSSDDETKQDQTKQETVIQQVTTNAEDNNAATELEKKSASENTVAKTVQPEEKEVNQQVADPTKDSTETEDDATAKQVETQTFEVKRDTKAVSEEALSESKA